MASYVDVRLIVGADGKPTSCNVQLEVRDADFQQVACETLMRNARFEPALDAAAMPLRAATRRRSSTSCVGP